MKHDRSMRPISSSHDKTGDANQNTNDEPRLCAVGEVCFTLWLGISFLNVTSMKRRDDNSVADDARRWTYRSEDMEG
jgi:hypothetical protein